MVLSMTDPYATIARTLGGTLRRRWTLHGGVSAAVSALELARPDGRTERVVVRQHGAADWKPLEEGVTGAEFALLGGLRRAGLPVPDPLLIDLSGEVLPAPYMVISFVAGAPEPEALDPALAQMAGFLARLHDLDPAALDLPALPGRDDPLPELLDYLPPDLAGLRGALAGRRLGAPPRASLLHGDFWPGNILWRGCDIAAVIDWEDAALGDPLADLAGCRVELLWRHGEAAMEAFTAHYRRLRGAPDAARLAGWELLVGGGGLAFMDRWGLAPEVEATMRARTGPFLRRAGAVVGRAYAP